MKYNFLFTTLPTNDLGLLTRSLPIADELVHRGHSVIFSNPSESPSKVIADAGFGNMPPKHPLYEIGFSKLNLKKFQELIKSPDFRKEYGGLPGFFGELINSFPLKRAAASNEVWDIDHAYAITGLLNFNFVKAQCIAYLKVIEKSKADIVVDFWNPFVCIACKKLGTPLITINQGDALSGSNGFIWWKEKPSNIPSVIPVINKVLKFFKLDTINKCEEINTGDLSLVVGMPETDPLHEENKFQYIGPVLWQNPNSDIPAWFNSLPVDKPIIWLYGGNFRYGGGFNKIFDSESMLKACYRAFENENYHIVLSLGHHNLPNELTNAPANFQCVSFVPGLIMAKRCDLMIHHGGYGSCQTGLVSGTPSLMLPTFSERESNARRITLIGAGDFVSPQTNKHGKKTFDVNEIKKKAKKILSDSLYKANAEKYGGKLMEYGGTKRAVDIIEKFIDTNYREIKPLVKILKDDRAIIKGDIVAS